MVLGKQNGTSAGQMSDMIIYDQVHLALVSLSSLLSCDKSLLSVFSRAETDSKGI